MSDLPSMIEQCLTNGPGDYTAQRRTVLAVLHRADGPEDAAALLDALGLRPTAEALRMEIRLRRAA